MTINKQYAPGIRYSKALIIFLMLTGLALCFASTLTPAAEAQQQAPASHFGQIPKTGITAGGTKNNADTSDVHWDIRLIYNESGKSTCQANNGPRLAITVEEAGTPARAGLEWDGISRPWGYTSNVARWLGQNKYGRSEGNGLHNPGPCNDPGTINPSPTPRKEWNTYVYRLRSTYSPTINSQVDLSTVQVTLKGSVDDFAGVVVSNAANPGGTPLEVTSCSGGTDTFKRENGQDVRMCQTGLGGNSTFTFGVQPGTMPFAHGANHIEVYVKSAFSNTGLIITEASLSGMLATQPIPTPTPQPAVCISYPPYGAFSPLKRSVSLPASGKPNNSSSSPEITGASGWNTNTGSWSGSQLSQSRSSTRTKTEYGVRYIYTYTYVTNNDGNIRTQVASVVDSKWSGESTPYIGGTNSSVTLDYQTHLDNYPYDIHQPVIHYQVRYLRSVQKQTGTRTVTETKTDSRSRSSPTASWQYSFGSWGNTSYGGWSWSNSGSPETGQHWTNTQSVAAPVMPPCYARTYSATPVITNTSLNPDPERPDQANMSFIINASFGVDYPSLGANSMRQASKVNNLGYVISRWIVRADGQIASYTNETASTNIAANSLHKQSTGSATYSRSMAVSVPGVLQTGDKVCWKVTLTQLAALGSRSAGRVGIDGVILSGSGQAGTNEICTAPIVNWPYLKIYGGDVMAGGGFGPSCSVNQGDIRSVTRPSGSSFVGSSVQYASLALGTINGFYSASLRRSDPQPQHGLSFANTPSPGNYSDNSHCLPDYFGYSVSAESYTGLSSLTSGNSDSKIFDRYKSSGPVTLSSGGSSSILIPAGARKVLFVDGDVTIRNNIEYPNLWLTRDSVPALYIVARNIYIDKDVTHLDGVFIAQSNNSSNGIINTCYGVSMTNLFSECHNQLEVNGSFIAQRVKFYRTYGSLRDGIVHERAGGGRACSNHGSFSVPNICAGEVFRFSPEIFLAPTPFGSQTSSGFILDSYGGLPPNL